MLGILMIIGFPFAMYVFLYIRSYNIGKKVQDTNAEINEVSMVKKPAVRKMAGIDIDKQYNLIKRYLKNRYPTMYYFSLKNCKVYSPHITVEILLEDKEEPFVTDIRLSEIMKSNTLSLDNWISHKKSQMEALKEQAKKDKRVFFTIPWDEIANEEFQKKIIAWYENHTMYRVMPGDAGLIFNFQDEMVMF